MDTEKTPLDPSLGKRTSPQSLEHSFTPRSEYAGGGGVDAATSSSGLTGARSYSLWSVIDTLNLFGLVDAKERDRFLRNPAGFVLFQLAREFSTRGPK